jgi:hypothetical protein
VKVYNKNVTSDISIYPNPVKNDAIHLYFSNMPAGKYKMSLLNSSGQLLLSKEVNHIDEDDQHLLQFNTEAPPGVYHLEIIKPDGMKAVINVSNN